MNKEISTLGVFMQRSGEATATQSVLEFKNGTISKTELANRCFPFIKFIAGHVTRKYGFRDSLAADDITSELWLRFERYIVPQYESERGSLGALTIKTCSHLCSYEARVLADIVEYQPQDDSIENSVEIDYDEIDKNMAQNRMLAILKKNNISLSESINISHTTTMNKKPNKTSTPQILSPSTLELQELKTKSGWTIERMSAELNIPIARFSSYLYGRTAAVPENVLDLARAAVHHSNSNPVLDHLNATPMDEIVHEWCKTCGITEPRLIDVVEICEVSASTARRWLENEVKPSATALMHYQRLVNDYARIKKQRTEAPPDRGHHDPTDDC